MQIASRECLNCLLYSGDNVGLCATSPTSRYETTYGVLLLSRKELKNTAAKGFTVDSHIRGFLQASVRLSFILDVKCIIQFIDTNLAM